MHALALLAMLLIVGQLTMGCDGDSSKPTADGGGLDGTVSNEASVGDGGLTPDVGGDDARPVDAAADGPAADVGGTSDAAVGDAAVGDAVAGDVAVADAGPDLPPPSATCAQAPVISVGAAPVHVAGDTTGVADEFATLSCSPTSGALFLDGPQAYYGFAAVKDQWYKVVLAPTFDAYFFLFTSSGCTEAAIEGDCQSDGVTGLGSRSVPAGAKQAIYLQAPATAPVYVGVDSIASWFEGPFELSIAAITRPTNRLCASATPLVLQAGQATVSGDTGVNLTPDEWSTLACSGHTLDGPQVYYSFTAKTGASYAIRVTSDSSQFLHPFVATHQCDTAKLSTDCSSGGTRGDYVSGSFGSGDTSQITFSPDQAGSYLIGIESEQAFNYGGFTLEIVETP